METKPMKKAGRAKGAITISQKKRMIYIHTVCERKKPVGLSKYTVLYETSKIQKKQATW
jgi:hypothetical protein